MSEAKVAIESLSLQEAASTRPPALAFQIAGAAPKYSVWPKRKIKRSWLKGMQRHKTKRIKFKLSVLVAGRHVGKGSILDLPQPIADDLIGAGTAVELNIFSRFFARVRFFLESRTKTERS